MGVLGPAGTFSDLAFSQFLSEHERVFFGDFPKIFTALFTGDLDAAFVPLKTEVRKVQEIEKLQKKYDFYIPKKFDFPVHYALVGKQKESIQQIFGRDEALAVCASFLDKVFPMAKKIAVSSSSVAVQKIAENPFSAAICPEASAGDFPIVEREIASGRTQFGLLQKKR